MFASLIGFALFVRFVVPRGSLVLGCVVCSLCRWPLFASLAGMPMSVRFAVRRVDALFTNDQQIKAILLRDGMETRKETKPWLIEGWIAAIQTEHLIKLFECSVNSQHLGGCARRTLCTLGGCAPKPLVLCWLHTEIIDSHTLFFQMWGPLFWDLYSGIFDAAPKILLILHSRLWQYLTRVAGN